MTYKALINYLYFILFFGIPIVMKYKPIILYILTKSFTTNSLLITYYLHFIINVIRINMIALIIKYTLLIRNLYVTN